MRLAKVVALALVVLTALAAAATAAPKRGEWTGSETAYRFNGKWVKYSSSQSNSLPVVFKVGRRSRVVGFSLTEFDYACPAEGAGASYSVDPSITGKLRKRKKGFSGHETLVSAGKTLRVKIRGRFVSKRRAKGTVKVSLSGCGVASYESKWKASRTPSGGGGGGGGGGLPGRCSRIVYDADGYAHVEYYDC